MDMFTKEKRKVNVNSLEITHGLVESGSETKSENMSFTTVR